LAEWLVEEGIGEDRAIALRDGEIFAARMEWPGKLTAGQIEDAVLVSRAAGARRGTARFASGEEALVDNLPPHASEGAPIRLLVTRAAVAEQGRLKRAQARPGEEQPRPAPSLVQSLRSEGHQVRIVRSFPVRGWEDIVADAFAREIAFSGGALLLCPTPAMTLIDIDGPAEPRALAMAAVSAIAMTLRRLDIAGSIGIDFPGLPTRDERRNVDAALAAALADWPHERTAMNGFGFVQIVTRLQRPSILHRAAHDPAGAAARFLLRQAERIAEPGALLLTAHPRVLEAIRPEWKAELARRTGRAIHLRDDSGLAPEAGFAQALSS